MEGRRDTRRPEKDGKGEIGRKRTAGLNREHGGEEGTRSPRPRRAAAREEEGTGPPSPLLFDIRSARLFSSPSLSEGEPRFDFSET
ncbi:hypothetical protein MRX96_026300 [Rhipicephalus microplus]